MTHQVGIPNKRGYLQFEDSANSVELVNYAQHLAGMADGFTRRALAAMELVGEEDHPHTVDALRRASEALRVVGREIGHSVEAVRS